MSRRHNHKCFIPSCPNSVSKTPNKLFISVNNLVKRKWCKQLNIAYDPQQRLYCCEDHLDLNEDLDNYYQWRFMNASPRLKPTANLRYEYSLDNKPKHVTILTESKNDGVQLPNDMENHTEYYLMDYVSQIRMRAGCLPTRFTCQPDTQTENVTTQPLAVKKERFEKIEECEREIGQVNSETSVSMAEVEPGPSAEDAENPSLKSDNPTPCASELTAGIKRKLVYIEIKPEPLELDEQDEAPEQNIDIHVEDIKIEVEEHPVASKLDENVPVFMPCTRQILPKINMFSIVEYIILNASYKDIDYKMLKTDIDTKAEDTIGFVQLHKMDNQLTLQATVAFDRVTAHVCIVRYDTFTQTIDYTNCECQQTACHHVLAFLMWLHRRSEEQFDNDMSFCLEPLVQQTTFLKAKDIVYDSDTDSLSEDPDMPENIEQFQQEIVHEFVRTCKELKMYNSPLYRYLNGNEQPDLSVHRMQLTWRDTSPPTALASPRPAHFIQYCTELMTEWEATLHQLATSQDYIVRQELQYARLEGQHIFDACSMESNSEQVEKKELIDALLNPDLHADDEFIEKMKTTIEKQLNIRISKCGIILSKNYPIFCAVPYGFTNTHVVDFVYCEKEEQITEYMEANVLKPNIQFRLQFNMLLANKEKSYFFIGFKDGDRVKRILILELKFNSNYCNTYLEKGKRFWEDNVFEMISPDHNT